MKTGSCSGVGVGWMDDDAFDTGTGTAFGGMERAPTPSPQEFRDGMQLVYAALLAGTELMSQDADAFTAFLRQNGAEAVHALGEEISIARMWCEQVAAALRALETRTLITAMSAGGRA